MDRTSPSQKPSDRFSVVESTQDEIVILSLQGQLDAHTAPEFERILEQHLRDQRQNSFILNFKDLDYISSAGLGVLMGLIEEVRAKGGDIRLCELPEKIFHVLDLLGFPVVFRIFSTTEEAVSSFSV